VPQIDHRTGLSPAVEQLFHLRPGTQRLVTDLGNDKPAQTRSVRAASVTNTGLAEKLHAPTERRNQSLTPETGSQVFVSFRRRIQPSFCLHIMSCWIPTHYHTCNYAKQLVLLGCFGIYELPNFLTDFTWATLLIGCIALTSSISLFLLVPNVCQGILRFRERANLISRAPQRPRGRVPLSHKNRVEHSPLKLSRSCSTLCCAPRGQRAGTGSTRCPAR